MNGLMKSASWLAFILCVSAAVFAYSGIKSDEVRSNVHWSVFLAVIAYFATDDLIPRLQGYMSARGLKGKDMGRKGRKDEDEEIPSALGAVVGVVFIICIIILQVFDANTSEELARYSAATMSICFMVFLGFADDVLDLPWRFKLILPPIASLPLLCSYTGETSIAVPTFLRPLLHDPASGHTILADVLNLFVVVDAKAAGAVINLGGFYFLYMSMLAVFCTNAINIYAGINGLEVGQSVVVAAAVLLTNLHHLRFAEDVGHPHVLSAMLMIAFIGVSLAQLKHNWFPARVFVGDTYCYFAGMSFAVVGILGHFSKTLLVYLAPQIFNFLYSCPQLFKIYPCPRHRLPAVDKDGLRRPSVFVHKGKEHANMTLINLVLRLTGPIREETLTVVLMVLQAVVCGAGFALREYLGKSLYSE
jgi:UDP-N-acetylglucosamine--dolichyl-phosphate N-acetylglucosaminephosphotransferase